MRFTRRLTEPDVNPLDRIEYEKRSSVITNPDGSVVFEMKDIRRPVFCADNGFHEIPLEWLVSPYCRLMPASGAGSWRR